MLKLIRIQIKGYKSLSDIDIRVDDMLALIGENNTGKSSILEALDKFFHAGKVTLGPEFFCVLGEPCNEIQITLTFSELSEEEKERFKAHIEEEILRVRRVAVRNATDGGELSKFLSVIRSPNDQLLCVPKGSIDSNHLQELMKHHSLPSYTHGKTGIPTVARVKENWARLVRDLADTSGWSSDFKESTIIGYAAVAQGNLPRYEWLPAVREVTDETKTTQKSRFGEILGEVLEESTSAEFAERITKLLDRIREALNVTARETTEDQRNPLLTLEQELNSLFNEHMPGASIRLLFNVPGFKDLMKQGSYVEIDDGVPSGLEHKGHGMQRLFIFMLLRVYAKRKTQRNDREARKFILAIEEPELYLHPPAQRQLLQVLKMIAPEQQVLLCTHSPYFIDMSNYQEVCVVSRDSRTSPTRVLQSAGDVFLDNEKDEFKLLSKIDPTRSELFFSKKVVLVEGDTERMTIPIIGEKLGFIFPLKGITVIEAGGKMALPFFMKIMNVFGIKYLTIFDEDPVNPSEQDAEKKKQAQKIFNFNGKIGEAVGSTGELLMIRGTFETLLGVSRNQMDKKGKPFAAYRKISDMEISQIPNYFIDSLKRFLDM